MQVDSKLFFFFFLSMDNFSSAETPCYLFGFIAVTVCVLLYFSGKSFPSEMSVFVTRTGRHWHRLMFESERARLGLVAAFRVFLF